MEALGVAGFVIPGLVLIAMFAMGQSIAVSMGVAGLVGFWMVAGMDVAVYRLASVAYFQILQYSLATVVLFVFMGEIIGLSGIGADLFKATSLWVGRVPGSTAVSTTVASGVFGAICGVSVAGALTIGEVAIPEMRKRGYDKAISAGVVAAGGTLSILIPPSLAFVLYGIIAEESIGRLFISGIVPGVILTILYAAYCFIHGWRHPEIAAQVGDVLWSERIQSLKVILPVGALFAAVLGTIYLGVATPTEAGALGASGALILAVAYGKLNLRSLADSCKRVATLVAAFNLIFIGAIFFGYYIGMAGYTDALVSAMVNLPVAPMVVILLIVLLYFVLGCFLETASMIFLTVPILLPVVKALGFDPIWFGVLVVICAEVAFITPPVGMNLFAIHSIARDVPVTTIARGALPFLVMDCVLLALIMAFPSLATWLPSTVLQVAR